jgi:hypothetical protein
MDYFTKIQKLFQTYELCKRRVSQLQLENTIDENINTNYNKCPELAFLFIMKMRKINRIYSSDIYNSSILDYPDKVEKNLNKADELYKMYDFTKPENTCKNIETILKTLNE